MKNKAVILTVIILGIIFTLGLNSKTDVVGNILKLKNKSTEVTILATTDLHSLIPDKLSKFIQKERQMDKNITLVDAGDFLDAETTEMQEWFSGQRLVKVVDGFPVYEKIAEPKEGVAPAVKQMADLKYDAIVLGNHEFVSNYKSHLDAMISDFTDRNIPILSANTYKSNGESYTKPYVVKEIPTSEGNIRLGILGLTIKEVGERQEWIEGVGLRPTKSRELKDLYSYENELYMNDLLEDCKKWVNVMKKDNVDVIITVMHSGEKPKKPKNPGNRVQELTNEVEGIDVIVAGHTHKQIIQHEYKNKKGQTVIVTQPGKHGECISKIKLNLEKGKEGWVVTDKTSNIVNFK